MTLEHLGHSDHRSKPASHTLESVIVLGLEGFVFSPSHLVNRFSEMLGDMELIVHEVGTGAVDIGEDGDVIMSFSKALFVDDEMHNGSCLATLEPPINGSFHDRLHAMLRAATPRETNSK